MTSIRNNLETIRNRIAKACTESGRDPADVRLVAVSKVKSAELVNAAFVAGQQVFGESYVQEFRDKAEGVTHPVEWHFVGALQSNKVKYLRGQVALIHSVDRLSLAREINRQWKKIDAVVPVLLQVNVGDESSKAGCDIDKLNELARRVAELPHLQIQGLMCLPPYCTDPEQVRPYFHRLRELAAGIDGQHIPRVMMKELSMGMSGDFEVAIEEGATLVRIGTAIFGERE